jgi:hypothetical protein
MEPGNESRQRKAQPVLTADEYQAAFAKLRAGWPEAIGASLAAITEPYMFSGRKRRRLVVLVRGSATPPWGTWQSLSSIEAERRTFTEFRKRVNELIAPHGVDHVEFRESPAGVTR